MKMLVPSGGGGDVVNFPTKNVIARFRRLAEIGDELVERYEDIRKASRNFAHLLRGGYVSPAELPDDAELSLTASDRENIAQAQALLTVLDPDRVYHDDSVDEVDAFTLKRDVIADQLAVLIGSFPTGQAAAPENFAVMLVEQVAAADVRFAALQTAIIDLVATRRAMPPIAAVMDALADHQARWATRRSAIFTIARFSEHCLNDLSRLRAKLAAQERAQTLRSARAEVARARQDLIAKQEHAAKHAQAVAAGFEALADAERMLRELEGACEPDARTP